MSDGFIKFVRSEVADELLEFHPKSFLLLGLIAKRARREKTLKLNVGESYIGDHEKAGLSRQEYRTALKYLKKHHFVTTKTTNRGTIATLINSEVYDINISTLTTNLTNEQPSVNHQATTNKKERSKERKKNIFIAPTLIQIENYFKEKSFTINPQTFYDYYDADEWRGVKNWKQKAISWNGREKLRDPSDFDKAIDGAQGAADEYFSQRAAL